MKAGVNLELLLPKLAQLRQWTRRRLDIRRSASKTHDPLRYRLYEFEMENLNGQIAALRAEVEALAGKKFRGGRRPNTHILPAAAFQAPHTYIDRDLK